MFKMVDEMSCVNRDPSAISLERTEIVELLRLVLHLSVFSVRPVAPHNLVNLRQTVNTDLGLQTKKRQITRGLKSSLESS